ncbi:hypothetical protein [Micromonospora chersina]
MMRASPAENVTYPVDLELVDLERNLADCLPADRLARLRERGLL